MKKAFGLAVIALAAGTAFAPAMAEEETVESTDFLTGVVDAAVPTGQSMDDMVFSGSLGVSRYLLCTLGKSVGGNPQDDGACPNTTE